MVLILFLAAALGSCQGTQEGSTPRRPNIVLILADDMGFSDLGCYGSEIETPNLDRLAAGGLRFTEFYNCSRCCPTRASLLTGLYPHQTGMGDMTEDPGKTPAYQGYLNNRCVTIAEVLRAAGYRTGMVGKWHVGEQRPHWPVDRGFDRFYGLISGASHYFTPSKVRTDAPCTWAIDGSPYAPPEDGFYATDAFTERALNFLDSPTPAPAPFFLYLAYTAPHWPLHARPEEIAKYRGRYRKGWDQLREERHRKMIEMGLVRPEWPLTPRDPAAPEWAQVDPDERDLRMAVYAAQIDRMDQGIGRIVEKLRRTGELSNTLILFLSDNGGAAEEVHRSDAGSTIGTKESYESYGLPWANASNTPFRLFKHWVHEGGIATPLIVSWPDVIRRPGITSEVGHVIDLMATAVDVAGASYPRRYQDHEIQPMEGKSLAPIFRTGSRPDPGPVFWEHEGNRAVRQGKWKLVGRHRGPWELYDMEKDRTELTNLSDREPGKVSELTALYQRWSERCGVVPWK
jgi:arylsulfatase